MIHRTMFTLPSSDGKTRLRGFRWQPDGQIRGVLQISHGMVEHLERYNEFAEYLAAQGYAVIGHDHLGHGGSVGEHAEYGFFAEENGDRFLLQDMHRVTVLAKRLYPDKPVFLLGHSMGSFLLRRYMTIYGKEISGAIICGTGNITVSQARLALMLSSVSAKLFGKRHHSKLIDLLALGQYALQYGNPLRPGSWLSKNEESVRAYAADPRCGFCFTVGAYRDFFRVLMALAKEKNFDRIPRDLPVFMISGMEDPLGGYTRAVLSVYNRFVAMGMKDIDIMFYPEDRHEILQETDRDLVFGDVLAWLRSHTEENA